MQTSQRRPSCAISAARRPSAAHPVRRRALHHARRRDSRLLSCRKRISRAACTASSHRPATSRRPAQLLTLCMPHAGNGPTTLRLADRAARDLRGLFDVGERAVCRDGVARTGRASLRLDRRSRLAARRSGPVAGERADHRPSARRGFRLAWRRCAHASVIRAWPPAVTGLRRVSRARRRRGCATRRSADRLGRGPDAVRR
jgi:hypothetical protein